jgi:acyl-[acyl carrier protein]--UDP-N-acetylglucosamine O-acyltransferase
MIHPTAVVADDAELGDDVEIGAFTLVHSGVRVGSGTVIGSHCSIGEPTELAGDRPLVLGAGCTVRSHSVIYAGSTFADGLETGHHATIREGITAGTNLRVGTLADLQGDTTFGRFVRLHSNVHVGKGSDVGDFVWIFPFTVLTNDPHPPSDVAFAGVVIEEFAVVTTMVCIAPGVRVGARSLVAASSMVTRDVPPDTVVRGSPARPVGPTSGVVLRDGSGRPAYPWTRHFHRGYPLDVIDEWTTES